MSETPDAVIHREDDARKWSEWADANFPPDAAARAKQAALEALATGGAHEAIYSAALSAASAEPPKGAKPDFGAALVAEVDHEHGTVGIAADRAALTVRTWGKNPLTRKEWKKEEDTPLASIQSVLVHSRDRLRFGFDVRGQGQKLDAQVAGVCEKAGLDTLMRELAERGQHIRIELAHPSYGVPDPFVEQVKRERETALAFNRDEEQRRANSGRREMKVETYDNDHQFNRDAQKRMQAGWMIQGQTAGRGGVSLGGTAAKLALTGGLGAITGFSRKGSKITVTWVRQFATHQPRELMTVPEVPQARTFPAEPYFEAVNLAPVRPGDEYPEATGETVTLVCFKCKADVSVRGLASDYCCGSCRNQYFMRYCQGCRKVIHIPASLQGKTVKCLGCGWNAGWGQWEKQRVPARQVQKRAMAPPTPTSVPGGTALASAPASVPAPTVAQRLQELSELKESGLITEEEFAAKRSELLEKL